jgi:hypothetical protein
MKEKNSRNGLISWLAYVHGGHNASPGTSSGRLWTMVDIDDDEAVARYFYKAITDDAEYELKNEITKPKAKIFDLKNKS